MTVFSPCRKLLRIKWKTFLIVLLSPHFTLGTYWTLCCPFYLETLVSAVPSTWNDLPKKEQSLLHFLHAIFQMSLFIGHTVDIPSLEFSFHLPASFLSNVLCLIWFFKTSLVCIYLFTYYENWTQDLELPRQVLGHCAISLALSLIFAILSLFYNSCENREFYLLFATAVLPFPDT